MTTERVSINQLKRFAVAFKEARDRGANESDTVMYLVKFFEEVLGYDSLAGEISKEIQIKDRYCDLAIKLDGSIQLLVEAKAAGHHSLSDKHIEQAENYASRLGLNWVLLTNGVHWQLYHVTFGEGEGEGIAHDLVFEVNMVEEIEANPENVWANIGMLTKESFQNEVLDRFWIQRKALAPASLIRALFSEPVLTVLRRELNRTAEIRLDMDDVFDGVRDVLSKEALLQAGEITMSKRRRRRRRSKKEDGEMLPNDANAAKPAPIQIEGQALGGPNKVDVQPPPTV